MCYICSPHARRRTDIITTHRPPKMPTNYLVPNTPNPFSNFFLVLFIWCFLAWLLLHFKGTPYIHLLFLPIGATTVWLIKIIIGK